MIALMKHEMLENEQNIPESTIVRLLSGSQAWLEAPSGWEGGVDPQLGAVPQRVLIFSRDDRGGFRAQVHHRLVLMLLLAGDGGVLIDHRLHPLRPGQSVLVLPYQGHYRSSPTGPTVWLLVTFEMPETLPLEPLRHRVMPSDGALHERVAVMLDAAGSAARADVPLHLALVLQRMLMLAHLTPARTAATRQGATGPVTLLVRRLTRLIAEQLEGPLRVESLCDQLAVSEGTLRGAVRRAFDMTPQRLVLQMKMHRAAQMLSLEGQSVQVVAGRLGFATPYAFSRAFHRVMGRTPRSYKKAPVSE